MMFGRHLVLVIVFSWVWVVTVCGQWRGPILSNLGPAEGLPGLVNDIVADSIGMLYLASNTGLYRYDGHSFTYYGFDPFDSGTIGPGEVLRLFVASDGMIWLAMRFGGLNSFNPVTEEFRRYPFPEMSFRSIPTAGGIWEDEQGVLWVGGSHLRLFAFDRHNEQYTEYSPVWITPSVGWRRYTILSIEQDFHHPDSLWLSVLDLPNSDSSFNSYGQVVFRKSTKEFIRTPFAFQYRYTDRDGMMWGNCWGNFIVKFDPKNGRQDTFTHHFYVDGKDLRPLTRDIEWYSGHMMVASSFSLMTFEDSSFQSLIRFPVQTELYSLYADPDRNLWIGTNQGVQVMNPRNQFIRFFSLDQFGMYNRIFPGRLAFDSTRETIYLSHTLFPHKEGYYQIPLKESDADPPRFIETPFHITGLAYTDQYGLLGVGNRTLNTLIPDKKNSIHPLQLTPDHASLPGTQHMQYHPDGWIGMIGSTEFIWLREGHTHIQRIALDQLPGSDFAKSFDNGFDGFSFGANNKAYLFSNELHRIDLETGFTSLLRYDPVLNPGPQRIQSVVEDPNGFIWMSTFFHIGKFQLKGDSLELIRSFRIADGMVSSGAFELHPDERGRMWVFTSSGLNAIDPVTNEIRFFSVKEGLPFPYLDPRQVLTLTDNRIATVCQNGVIVFQADSLWSSGSPSNATVIVKRIRINGKEYKDSVSTPYVRYIELSSRANVIDLEVQALAFPSDYRMEYSYRILGLFEDWISIGRNQFITLPNLGPGRYDFQIKAGGIYSDAPVTTLQLYKPTPFFRKVWFLLGILAVAISFLYGIQQWRIRRRTERDAELAAVHKKITELELSALRSQMNPHFMFNSLNAIKNYILQSEPLVAAEYLSSFSHLIRRILQHSREKTIPLQEEIETLQLYIELEQIRFNHSFDFSITTDPALQADQIKIAPLLLQPFVENAIWHGLMHKKERGLLRIAFEKEDQILICTVEDNGIGRKKANEMKSLSAIKYKSMGMGITLERMDIMNKIGSKANSFVIEDKVDENGRATGTKITVSVYIDKLDV